MVNKYIGEGSINNRKGELLVARYVHSGNQVLNIASMDWVNAVATFSAPHGLTVGTKYNVLMCPNSWTIDNPTNGVLSMPMEWVKMTTSNTNLSIVPQDATTAKVTKDDGTTLATVTVTSTENNNNVDITKFHFEIPIGITMPNFQPVKKARMRLFGFIKNNSQYRYTQMRLLMDDGSYNGFTPSDAHIWGYINPLGIPSIPNAVSTNGIFGLQEWVVDISTSGQVLWDRNSVFYGRRAGYNNLVWDSGTETGRVLPITGFNFTNSLNRVPVGIVGIQNYGGQGSASSYAYHSNGTVIEIYDLGGA